MLCCLINPNFELLTWKFSPSIKEMRTEYDKMFRALIVEEVEEGVFITCDLKLMSLALIGAANFITQWYRPNQEKTKYEISTILAEYLMNGLLARNSRPKECEKAL